MGVACPVCSQSTTPGLCGLSTCQTCTHAFQTDLTVTADYAGDYGARTYDTYPPDTSLLRAGYVLGRTCLTSGKVLDIGYGNGAFLALMRKGGFSCFGNDLHQRPDGVRRGSVDDAYDVITMFDSLEHLPSLALPMLAEHIIISIPHRPMWFLKHPENWRHFKPGEHLHYFTPRSLSWLMDLRGLSLRHRMPLEDIARRPQVGLAINIMTYHFARN